MFSVILMEHDDETSDCDELELVSSSFGFIPRDNNSNLFSLDKNVLLGDIFSILSA